LEDIGVIAAAGMSSVPFAFEVNTIRFAQRGVSSVFRNGQVAKRAIADVAAGLKSGAIALEDLPI
jgi:hypothetical protein